MSDTVRQTTLQTIEAHKEVLAEFERSGIETIAAAVAMITEA